jgi:hypothetical protein
LQDSNYARPIKEARAYNLACLAKEAKALDIKGINSENTIIIYILKRSNLVKGSKSYIIYTNFTSYINFTNCKKGKNWIKARKADKAELRDWPP